MSSTDPRRSPIPCSALVALLVLGAGLRAQQPGAPSSASPGLKVSFAPLEPERRQQQGRHSYRARLLSTAVERGETPTPLIDAGMFEVQFDGLLPLPVRDRFQFRLEGRGSAELRVNGEAVLSGSMRPGKPLETSKAVKLQKGDNAITVRGESNAVGELQLRLSWSGSDFAFEPIAPELWRWPEDDADIAAGERLRRGHQLFVGRRCARCHEPDRPIGESAQDELVQSGPDLRGVGARVHQGFLAEWLRDPRGVRTDASMPRFRFERERDADDLAAFLATLGQPLQEPPAPPDAAATGAERFLALGCVACHTAPGDDPGAAAASGRLALAFVPRKWRRLALEQYLLDPTRDYPHTRMPNLKLTAADATALAAMLVANAPPAAAARGDADAGRRLAVRHGCDRCHELQLPETGRRDQELRALHDDHGCLAGPGGEVGNAFGEAPDHGFADDQLAALRAFLPHALAATKRRSPLDYTARMLPQLRCTQCHGLDGRSSAWAELVAQRSQQAPVPAEQDPVAQGVPSLTWAGSKLQPSWLERFVTGREPSPRPWLHARMPAFALRGGFIVQGLVRQAGYGQADEPPVAADASLVEHGRKLVEFGTGFACVQCHGVGPKPPVQVFERQGINFAVAVKRLRHEYYMRWLLNPQRIDPDARMPQFADAGGKTAFVDILGGDGRQQFEAIWQWLRTLSD